MGWKGTVRTVVAASRRAEREAAKRTRERARHIAALEKEEIKERAAEAVHEYERYVANLISLHRACSSRTDWLSQTKREPPLPPYLDTKHASAARHALATYRPSLLSRILGRTVKERGALELALAQAPERDQLEFEAAQAKHRNDLDDHREEVDFAQCILRNDETAMLEAVKLFEPLGSIDLLGEHLSVSVLSPRRIGLELTIHGEEILPKDRPKLLSSGKMSVKPMPKGDYYRLYQDHVCSAALRAARELLALLPIDEVVVTAVDDLVNPATGHLERTPILSFLAPRKTVEQLNFEALDPSDSMKNFKHTMDFSPTSGLKAVAKVEAPQ